MTCRVCGGRPSLEVRYPGGLVFACSPCALVTDWTDLLGVDDWAFWSLLDEPA